MIKFKKFMSCENLLEILPAFDFNWLAVVMANETKRYVFLLWLK